MLAIESLRCRERKEDKEDVDNLNELIKRNTEKAEELENAVLNIKTDIEVITVRLNAVEEILKGVRNELAHRLGDI